MSSPEASPEAPAPRLSVRLPARISTVDPETDPFTGKSFFRTSEECSANVSETGLFVVMSETIPPGRRVLVELELPGGRVVQQLGRVAWTRTMTRAERAPDGPATHPGVGIEFTGGHPDDCRALERYLLRQLQPRETVAPSPNASTNPA